jgi:hypothetical protein
MTRFEFTNAPNAMNVAVSYDTGWNHNLDCDGKGGWTDSVALNDDDAALMRITNIQTRSQISVCGQRGHSGMTWSVIANSDSVDGFDIEINKSRVTVTCYAGFTVEYISANQPSKI